MSSDRAPSSNPAVPTHGAAADPPSPIRMEVIDHVARITIDRPERMNAFDDHTHVAFSAAVDRVEDRFDLTGRPMTAARAYALGLVNEVVSTDQLDRAVDGWMADILACSPIAVRATKQSAVGALHLSLAEANRYVAPWEARRRTSDDAREGPRAFAEKRDPHWRGR